MLCYLVCKCKQGFMVFGNHKTDSFQWLFQFWQVDFFIKKSEFFKVDEFYHILSTNHLNFLLQNQKENEKSQMFFENFKMFSKNSKTNIKSEKV